MHLYFFNYYIYNFIQNVFCWKSHIPHIRNEDKFSQIALEFFNYNTYFFE